MKFILNKFPEDKSFDPNEEWTPLKESANLWMVQLQALPFMAINILLVLIPLWQMGLSFKLNVYLFPLSFILFAPFHELIHALFFPERLSSNNVYFGFTTKGFAPFAAYTGEMKRNTFILSLLAPFVIISLLGYAYLILFGDNNLIKHIIVINALGACADCLGIYLIGTQVPNNAIVRNKGIKTFWRINS